MLPTTLLLCLSTAVAALGIDSRYAEELRAVEARAVTTLFTTSTVYSTSTTKTTTCIFPLGNLCLLYSTKTVTTTVPVQTTVVAYKTSSIPDPTSTVKSTSSSVTTSSASSSKVTTSTVSSSKATASSTSTSSSKVTTSSTSSSKITTSSASSSISTQSKSSTTVSTSSAKTSSSQSSQSTSSLQKTSSSVQTSTASSSTPTQSTSSGTGSSSSAQSLSSTAILVLSTSSQTSSQSTLGSSSLISGTSSSSQGLSTSTIPTSASLSTTAAAVPTCGFVGYDNGTTNLGFYADNSSATYDGCNTLCNSNTACLSFAYSTSPSACILYGYVVEGYDTAYASSPYTFFDRGGVCPTTTSAATTTASAIPEPTCGLTGWEISGTNIGYYVNITTYSGCNDLCNSNPSCLSLAYAADGTCVLYAHVVEGNVTADSTSPYTYFDRGSICPQASTTSSTTSATSTVAAAPSFTAGIQYCPSGYTTYNTTDPVLGYSGCNTTYVDSTCASGVDGSALCNLCGSCYNDTACTSTAQCQTTYGAGYACVSGSACVTGGTPVCLYMLAGGDAYGCYGADSGGAS